MEEIRNFVIIAHVDHGKSTLADRFLEITNTVPERRMKPQYLDQLELERERGITIKMAPVRMTYKPPNAKKPFILNLIDTPGHSDFAYEVSRALTAVEGAILLVDATQGIQAQTIANLNAARRTGLTIIGAINKVDLFENVNFTERLDKIVGEVAELLGVSPNDIFKISGKTGKGVKELLDGAVAQIPPPRALTEESTNAGRALIFDSFYDDHRGIIASVRVFEGEIHLHDELHLLATETQTRAKELGHFLPQLTPLTSGCTLSIGDIGYIATGVRDPEKVKIGDSVIAHPPVNRDIKSLALAGYEEPQPTAFVSFYPEEGDDYELLTRSLARLRLNDAALSIEPDQNELLGRGFKVGFLGRLHFEITGERLKREFGVETVNTFPSVRYRIKTKRGWQTIIKPEDLPNDYEEIWEPTVRVSILLPHAYVDSMFPLFRKFSMRDINTAIRHDHAEIIALMPLAELISDFDDQLKSLSQGYASFSYELTDYTKADIVKVDIFVSHRLIPGLSRFFPKDGY
ncbi:GTP-binding protein, partial [Candidatus Jorgensenbacteria bacterium]|nr:GTP-binding protein [Candidatus Jorgensenbacteria bacterium]